MEQTHSGSGSMPQLTPKQQKPQPGETYRTASCGRLTAKSLGGTGTITHTGPINVRASLLKDSAAQDLAADCGVKRTLNTNIRDYGPTINNNTLRFVRKQDYASAMVQDGGTTYSPTACTGNWVEDRRDKAYTSGFHPRELGFVKIYQSEASAQFRPTSSMPYYAKVHRADMLAKGPPRSAHTAKLDTDADGSYLYYSKGGFGDARGLDHTSGASRGGYWVGTAPVRMHESIATTAARSEPLEFQRRNSCYDATAKLLAGMGQPHPNLSSTVKNLRENERWASTWTTTSSTAFKDYSGRGTVAA
ncbi:hypothetical protein FOA52_005585 [Chlamydomonas sp. UWO 241]|nr:hypothetical protein FOA52_005585 [Chlamydomonas sp. UWO 241]